MTLTMAQDCHLPRPGSAAPAIVDDVPMRFMFVGDSMTIGSVGDFTWRYRMWQHLNASYGAPYAIVGPRTGLYDMHADAPVSHAYGAPDFPARAWGHLAGWGEGGSTWRR